MKLELLKQWNEFALSLLPERLEILLGVLIDRRRRHFAFGVAAGHVEQTADEVAQIVGKITIITAHKELD